MIDRMGTRRAPGAFLVGATPRIVALGIAALGLAACGNDSLKSNLDREVDRGRENSQFLNAEYSVIEGQYEIDPTRTRASAMLRAKAKLGKTLVSPGVLQKRLQTASNDSMQDWIEMDVEAIPVQRDGSLVPMPALAGTFRFWPTDSRGLPLKGKTPLVFNFTNGVFDQGTGELAVKIAGINTDGIQISCRSAKNSNASLDCAWIPSSGRAERRQFVLRRTGDLQ